MDELEIFAEMMDPHIRNMIEQAQAQYGDALQGIWFNEGEVCPGCGGNFTPWLSRGRELISLNGFFHRPGGVLIAYFLCGRCAGQIHRAGRRNPFRQIPLHKAIEKQLIENFTAYRAQRSA